MPVIGLIIGFALMALFLRAFLAVASHAEPDFRVMVALMLGTIVIAFFTGSFVDRVVS